MTVSTTDSVETFSSGGPNFPIPYRFLQNSDIEAVLTKQDGTTETLTGAQYTLTGAGAQSGGTLTSTYAAGVLAVPGATLTISRVMVAVQPTDLRNQGRFLAETHENVFDRLTMLIQQGFAWTRRALLRPIGKDYYDAEGRRIANVADPVQDQDAATKKWSTDFIGNILETGQGPINNAANVILVGANGTIGTVQDAADKDDPTKGAAMWGFRGDSLEARLDKVLYASQFKPAIVDAATFQTFLNLGTDRRLVVDIPITVTKAGLEALPGYGLSNPPRSVVQWVDGAWTTLEPGVQVRHIFVGSGGDNSDVLLINPQIDGQDSSANGYGGANSATSRLSNVWIIGGVIKNIARQRDRDSFEGGSGVTFQFGVDNCGAIRTKFYRVNCATDATGRNNATVFGAQRTYNIIFDQIHCEQCEMLGHSYDLTTLSSITAEMNAVARWSNFTFLNCGRSNIVGTWPGLSFVRVNTAGNGSPWTDVNIPSTSYSGNWQPETFASADAEWSRATASYALASRVKVTNDGTLSALFHFEGNAGCVIDGVNGYNEPSFGQIGAIIGGGAGGCAMRNVHVLLDAKSGVHCGSVPNMWPIVTRKDRSWVDSQMEFTNLGTTVRVSTADAPGAGDTTPYRQRGLKIKAMVRRSTVTEVIDSWLGGASDPWRNWIEASDCAGAGTTFGTFGFVYNAQNTIPVGNGETTFNKVRCEPLSVKVYQTDSQIQVERAGTGSGSAQIFVNGTTLHVGTAGALEVDAVSGRLILKKPDGTRAAISISNANALVVTAL